MKFREYNFLISGTFVTSFFLYSPCYGNSYLKPLIQNLDHYANYNYLSDALNHWWRLGSAVIPAASGLFDGLESLTNLIIQGIIDTGLAVMNAWAVAWSAVGLVYDLNLLAIGEFLTKYF